MICKNCDTQLPDNTTICPQCGADQVNVDKGGFLPETKRYLRRQAMLTTQLVLLAILVILILFENIGNILVTRRGRVNTQARHVRMDERSIAIALESFYSDRNEVPANPAAAERMIGDVYVGSINSVAWRLTSPIAYITSFADDRFRKGAIAPHYLYASDGLSFWVVWSAGPDRTDNIMALADLVFAATDTWTDSNKRLCRITHSGLTYAASNGTESKGDVWRCGP